MSRTATSDAIGRGTEALAAGDWTQARAAFEEALAAAETPEAFDGLGRALWWLGETDPSLGYRERAYAGFKRRGDRARALRIALWLSREYLAVHGNRAAANGWLARAERLAEGLPEGSERGWLDLARAERADDPAEMERHARAALDAAARFADPDLEIYALARLGLAQVALGQVDEGVARLDEAMAAATGEEAADRETVADTCCTMLLASDVLVDLDRFAQWSHVIEEYMTRHRHLPLLGFCRTCCGEVFAAHGKWEEAEKEYLGSLRALERKGHRSRCVQPAARLAALRVRQGRLEEADEILSGYRDLPDAAEPGGALHLARGEAAAAEAVLQRRLGQVGERSLQAVPLLSLLVQARVAREDLPGAKLAAKALGELAAVSGLDRVAGIAALASGRVAAAQALQDDAVAGFERALELFTKAHLPLEAARAHLELSRVVADDDPQAAVAEARAALDGFERLGARREADQAASHLRGLGVRGHTGPKGLGLLTRREQEVLRLVAEGLTNAEIASRLFISVKTAGNHVSSILVKLGLRTRVEAAAYAARRLPETGDK